MTGQKMKFSVAQCPECGEPAIGTLDLVPAVAMFEFDDDGTAEYTGGSDMWWDDQYTPDNEKEEVELICDNGHRWWSAVTEVEEKADEDL